MTTEVEDALARARAALPDDIEALVIIKQEDDSATPLYRIYANLGWADEIIATDLYHHIALGIAHALNAVFECGVYEDGERL